MVHRTKEDALNEREYELLMSATYQLDEPYELQSRFALLLLGRLGLRPGELCHIQEEWVNWRKMMINIPYYEGCNCGYCKQQAEQEADHNEDINFEEAINSRWKPKTDGAVREVPFDFSAKVKICMEKFFDEYDKWPRSKQSINRRIDKLCKQVKELDKNEIYPHCLRATAATHHAGNGLDTISLQSLMGWANISTSRSYIKHSGQKTQSALNQIHK